jgi:hypothetical protein
MKHALEVCWFHLILFVVQSPHHPSIEQNFLKDVLAACCTVRTGQTVAGQSGYSLANQNITVSDLFAALMTRPAAFGPILSEAHARLATLL